MNQKNDNTKEKVSIVYLTTYPPRACGIATFTSDLIDYSDELFLGKVDTKVVAMRREADERYTYSDKVIFEISENDKNDYEKAAMMLNEMKEVKIVSIQHEFGIFGNNYGESLIYFLEKIKKPIAVTLHTVLPNPDEGMKRVMEKKLEILDSHQHSFFQC